MPQPLTLEQALALARDLAESGELTDAAGVCASVLRAVANEPRALHLLGVLASRMGPPLECVELLRRAVRSDPGYAAAHNDLGNILARQGIATEAIDSYRRAIASDPPYPEAHNNLGNLYQMTGALQDAADSYRAASTFGRITPRRTAI